MQVADEPGADGESSGLQTGEEESFLDQLRRGVLGAAEFGVRVQVAAQRDETFGMLVEPAVERGVRHRMRSVARLSTR